MTKKAILLMGPTASGKSELALELARRFDGEIVSVDSAQVYRGMDIGTAKPSEAVRAAVPHHLIDIRDPADAYSAAAFRADALAAMDTIRGHGRIPVLAGGTMLYFRALTEGLAPMPPSDAGRRAELDELARVEGNQGLHRRLARVDAAAAARIHPNDPQRLKRALEVFELTGKPISEWQQAPRHPPAWQTRRLVLCPPDRADLHRRIAERFQEMLAAGFIEEVRGLFERGDLTERLPAIRAVGYRQAWDYLAGRCNKAEMVQRAIAATRQLAKRQMTWLRREPDALWLETGTGSAARQAQRATAAFLAFSA